MNTDFAALARLRVGSIHYPPDGLSLAWFAHASVRHLALDSAFATPAPRVRGVFAPEGAFHALGSLRMLVPYYDAQLDVLPRLQSAFLGGGVLTPGFVALETWRGAAPPWSS